MHLKAISDTQARNDRKSVSCGLRSLAAVSDLEGGEEDFYHISFQRYAEKRYASTASAYTIRPGRPWST